MNILILGSGGREHALAWAIAASPLTARLICAPGNAGIAQIAQCVALDIGDPKAVIACAKENSIDLVVVGPEGPLCAGIVDDLEAAGVKAFGPSKWAARLEGSKGFTKDLCKANNIPTAAYARFKQAAAAKDYVRKQGAPIVVKADGLAAGKGVVVAATVAEAEAAIDMMFGGGLGQPASNPVWEIVIEDCLIGEEASFFALCDGETALPLASAQDHKRVGDGDTGPNTGGMGAYSIDDMIDDPMREWLLAHIARPVVSGMKAEGAEYRGILYCGLMMTARGPMVLEFNCRFGDPETQPIVMRMESDIVEAFEAAVEGRVSEGDFKWSRGAAVCVVLASAGYPGKAETGKKISGLDRAAAMGNVEVFHAATSQKPDGTYTSGGRVLGVTAKGTDLRSAVDLAYKAVAEIQFEGMQYRRDIGAKALK
jgi:phosphoribosylamine---glycine ligase